MGYTRTKQMTVILEADPDEEGCFDLVSVNGKTPEQVKAEPSLSEQERVEVQSAIKNGDPEATGLILDLLNSQTDFFKPKATGERLTDEQCLVELWSQVDTDAFWSHDDPPDMQGKPYLKLVGHIWWEAYNSVDYGWEIREGLFEIEEQELLDTPREAEEKNDD
jgi:hypothetical protein